MGLIAVGYEFFRTPAALTGTGARYVCWRTRNSGHGSVGVEQRADRFAVVDAPDGFREGRRDGQDNELWRALLGRDGHGVGADDLEHVGLIADPLECAVGEQSVRAGDPDRPDAEFAQAA